MFDLTPQLALAEVFTQPFPYFTSPAGWCEGESLALLSWLEQDAPWRLTETDFYEQFEFNFLDAQLPAHLASLVAPAALAALRRKVAALFQTALAARVDVSAHKLAPGQRIRLHNDFMPGQESHRLLLQLNRGWHVAQGGLLLFFNSAEPSDIHKIFLPAHNSVVGFAISQASYHAVSALRDGVRYTLVYSFYGR